MILKTIAFLGEQRTTTNVYSGIVNYTVHSIIGVHAHELKSLHENKPSVLLYLNEKKLVKEEAKLPLSIKEPFVDLNDHKEINEETYEEQMKGKLILIHIVTIQYEDGSHAFFNGTHDSFYFMNDEGKTIDKY